MNEELAIAMDELRLRPTERIWFIPVLLSDCDIPDRQIGGGESLCDIQWVSLHEDWDAGISRLLSVVAPMDLAEETRIASSGLSEPWSSAHLDPCSSGGSWHSHMYSFVYKRWAFVANKPSKALDAQQFCERELVCLADELPYIDIYVKKEQELLPFAGNYHVEAHSFRRENGDVNILPPHKRSGAQLTFRVTFDPPLREGEGAYFSYSFQVPRYRFGSLQHLREEMRRSVLPRRDYESCAFKVSNPIRLLRYEIDFTPDCSITPLGMEVLRGNTRFEEEKRLLLRQDGFEMRRTANGGWRFQLRRDRPPPQTKYRFMWRPCEAS